MADENPELQAALQQLDQELEVWSHSTAFEQRLSHCVLPQTVAS